MTAVRPLQELLALGRIDEPLAGWRRSNAQFSASVSGQIQEYGH
jgi:hypothetical protein